MLLKCQKAAVRRKLRDRNPDLFSAFEIFDHKGMNDLSVAPRGSAKMTMRLRAATSRRRPVLLCLEYGAGHCIESPIASARNGSRRSGGSCFGGSVQQDSSHLIWRRTVIRTWWQRTQVDQLATKL
jgi:hypothetical protein